jgi:hypothetical protein
MLSLRLVLALAAASLWTTGTIAQTAQQPSGGDRMLTTAGWIETVSFPDYGIVLDGKLDTGADSSSLDVSALERFKRNGKIWYRFTIRGEDGKTATIEQQTNRTARIMRAEVEDTRRPIVRLKICVAGHVGETDFTLTDRSEQRTPLLIGRRFLASRILVDSERMHIAPKCEHGK